VVKIVSVAERECALMWKSLSMACCLQIVFIGKHHLLNNHKQAPCLRRAEVFMAEVDPVRVGISGSYGGLNLGDEAILHSIIYQIKSSINAEITVFTRNAEDTLNRHHVEHAVLARNLARHEIVPEIE